MSQQKEIEAVISSSIQLFQVSEALLKAFEQIHQITGDFIKNNKQKKNDKPQESSKPPQNEEKKTQDKKK